MDLTTANKQHIDSLTHFQLLRHWRYAPAGDPWFQGETGQYWRKRMTELREKDPAQAVANSKALTD